MAGASRLQDAIQRGTRAAQPAATTVAIGVVYYVTDESVTERSNGTVWQNCADSGAGTASSVFHSFLLMGA